MEIKLTKAFTPAHMRPDPTIVNVVWVLIATKDGKEGHVQLIHAGDDQFEYTDFVVALAQLMKSMEIEKSGVFIAARELMKKMDMEPQGSGIEIETP